MNYVDAVLEGKNQTEFFLNVSKKKKKISK